MPSDDGNVTRLPVHRPLTIDFGPEAIRALEIIAQAQAANGETPLNITTRTNLGVQVLAKLIEAAGGVSHLEVMVRPHRRSGAKGRWVRMTMKI
jgi:hypothetical protein